MVDPACRTNDSALIPRVKTVNQRAVGRDLSLFIIRRISRNSSS